MLLAACTGTAPTDSGPRLYRVQDPLERSVSFRIVLEDPKAIDEAEALLASGDPRWIVGRLQGGDGGYNAPWSWHLDPTDPAGITFSEITIEECQATPGSVEANLQVWLRRIRLTCLAGRIAQRLQ